MESIDIVHGIYGMCGQCPWNPWNVWTMSMESRDNVQVTVDIVHGIFPASHERVDKFHGHCTLSSMDNFFA